MPQSPTHKDNRKALLTKKSASVVDPIPSPSSPAFLEDMPAERDGIEQVSAGCTAGSVARYFLDEESVGEDKFKRAGSRDRSVKGISRKMVRANSGMPALSEAQQRCMRDSDLLFKQQSEY